MDKSLHAFLVINKHYRKYTFTFKTKQRVTSISFIYVNYEIIFKTMVLLKAVLSNF
jgi:hypothetical protein